MVFEVYDPWAKVRTLTHETVTVRLRRGECQSDIARDLKISRQRVEQIRKKESIKYSRFYRNGTEKLLIPKVNQWDVSLVRVFRQERGIKAKDLAKEINVHQQSLLNWELGKKIRPKSANKIAVYFGKPIDEIFEKQYS